MSFTGRVLKNEPWKLKGKRERGRENGRIARHERERERERESCVGRDKRLCVYRDGS